MTEVVGNQAGREPIGMPISPQPAGDSEEAHAFDEISPENLQELRGPFFSVRDLLEMLRELSLLRESRR